MTFNTSKF